MLTADRFAVTFANTTDNLAWERWGQFLTLYGRSVQAGDGVMQDQAMTPLCLLRTVMETLGERECLVSDLGLREGVLIDLAMQTR